MMCTQKAQKFFFATRKSKFSASKSKFFFLCLLCAHKFQKFTFLKSSSMYLLIPQILFLIYGPSANIMGAQKRVFFDDFWLFLGNLDYLGHFGQKPSKQSLFWTAIIFFLGPYCKNRSRRVKRYIDEVFKNVYFLQSMCTQKAQEKKIRFRN